MALKANGTLEKTSKFYAQVDTGGCRNRIGSGCRNGWKQNRFCRLL